MTLHCHHNTSNPKDNSHSTVHFRRTQGVGHTTPQATADRAGSISLCTCSLKVPPLFLIPFPLYKERKEKEKKRRRRRKKERKKKKKKEKKKEEKKRGENKGKG